MSTDAVRVLIVEDEAIVAMELQERLSDFGYDVVGTAADDEEAFRKADVLHPDLILMDIVLRGNADGVEAAAKINVELEIPVVFVTAHADAHTVERAQSGNPYGYIVKPFNDQEVRAAIETALVVSRYRTELEANRRWLATTLGSIGDGVIATDSGGLINMINTAAEEITGLARGDALGQDLSEALSIDCGEILSRGGSPFDPVLEAGRTVHVPDATLSRDSGADRVVDCKVSPMLDERGRISGAVLVLRDVTERHRYERDLEESTEQLARSNHDLQQFAYVVSHDLQEPLRMVTSYLNLIRKRYLSQLDADADEFIEFAVDGAARMQRLLVDLLSYSRVESKGQDFGDVDANEVISRTLENLSLAIADAEADVRVDDLPVVVADETQLLQLFQNLIGNALKFRDVRRRSIIHVAVRREEPDWIFTVEDNGIGIDMKYAERIFLIFQRLHRQEEFPGTGVGLAICKRIVERHRGRMWIESKLGVGSTFGFTLPVRS